MIIAEIKLQVVSSISVYLYLLDALVVIAPMSVFLYVKTNKSPSHFDFSFYKKQLLATIFLV